MAATKKTSNNTKKEDKYQILMVKLLVSLVIYILVIIILKFDFFSNKTFTFLKKNLFYNADIKNTISNITEMYNNNVVPVINNFSDVND